MALSHFKSHKHTDLYHEHFLMHIFLSPGSDSKCVCVGIRGQQVVPAHLHSLDGVFLGLQCEVAVVLPPVCEVNKEGGERPEGLWVFSLQLPGYVESVDHLALPSFCSLLDAVQKLHLSQHTCPTNAPFTPLTHMKASSSSSNKLTKVAHKWGSYAVICWVSRPYTSEFNSLQVERVRPGSLYGHSAFLTCKLHCLPCICPGHAMWAWGQRIQSFIICGLII